MWLSDRALFFGKWVRDDLRCRGERGLGTTLGRYGTSVPHFEPKVKYHTTAPP